MEGLQFDQLKIHEGGRPNETLLRVLRDNIRFPEASLGDLRSQIAACQLGARRLEELYQRYGAEIVTAGVGQIFGSPSNDAATWWRGSPTGCTRRRAFLDDDGRTLGEPIDIHACVTVSGSDMTIDLSGCSGQRDGAINSRTRAGAMVAYKALTTPEEPVNAGAFRGA